MGLDDRTFLFTKRLFAPEKRILFLGYPTVFQYDESNRFAEVLEKCNWESCDISQNTSRNHAIDILDFDKSGYDLIIDHGTLQHIIDPIGALRKLLATVAIQGEVCHILPFSGFQGFGYWQFSPELFTTLQRLGVIEDLKIFIVDDNNSRTYFEPNLDVFDFRLRLGRETRMFIYYRKIEQLGELRNVYQEDRFSTVQDDVVKFTKLKSYKANNILADIFISFKDLIYWSFLRIFARPIWSSREASEGVWRRFADIPTTGVF